MMCARDEANNFAVFKCSVCFSNYIIDVFNANVSENEREVRVDVMNMNSIQLNVQPK